MAITTQKIAVQDLVEQFRRDHDPYHVFETRTKDVDAFVKDAAASILGARLTFTLRQLRWVAMAALNCFPIPMSTW